MTRVALRPDQVRHPPLSSDPDNVLPPSGVVPSVREDYVRLQRPVRRLAPSWNQFKGPKKARTDSYRTKVAPISRQDSVNASTFSNCGNGAINQTEVEPCESCIQFCGSGYVRWKRRFILVSCSWIEDIRDQPSHGCAVVSEKVVDLGENEPGHNYRTRRR